MSHIILRNALVAPDVDVAFAWSQLSILIRSVIHLVLLSAANLLISRTTQLALIHNSVTLHTLIHLLISRMATRFTHSGQRFCHHWWFTLLYSAI